MGTQMEGPRHRWEQFTPRDQNLRRPVRVTEATRHGPERYWRISSRWQVAVDRGGSLWIAQLVAVDP